MERSDQDFELIVKQHLKSVYNFTYRLVKSEAEASDLTQEVFIKVWKNLSRFDSSKNFKTWLFTIARNTVIDHWRRKKELPLPEDLEIEDVSPLPDELFFQSENKQKLDQALDTLSLDYKTVVVLHSLEELTFEEVSQIVGKPLNTVKSQYRRALHQMREWLRIH